MDNMQMMIKFDNFAQHMEEFICTILADNFTLSLINLKALVFIFKHGDPPSQNKLSQMLCVERSYIVKIIDTLEQDDLLIRQVNPTNRRENLLVLTELGLELVNKVIAIIIKESNYLLNDVTPEEQKIFINVLDKIMLQTTKKNN